MRERDFQTRIKNWLKENVRCSIAVEFKLTKTNSIPFSALSERQEYCLKMAKEGSFVYKVPDEGLAPKPFDIFALHKVPAYVAVVFYTRGVKEFFLIDIDNWIKEKDSSPRKSLTLDRIREISSRFVL